MLLSKTTCLSVVPKLLWIQSKMLDMERVPINNVVILYCNLDFFCYNCQCKEWGFLLKKRFGVHLGTGDYGHLVIDHSAILLRHFRSIYKYSGQGFEASHKLHRQLYSKATNHDSSGPGQSCELQDTVLFSSSLLS